MENKMLQNVENNNPLNISGLRNGCQQPVATSFNRGFSLSAFLFRRCNMRGLCTDKALEDMGLPNEDIVGSIANEINKDNINEEFRANLLGEDDERD